MKPKAENVYRLSITPGQSWRLLFFLIVVAGVFLRFYRITEEGFWFDEVVQVQATRLPFFQIFDHLPHDKPQLDYILQHFFVRIAETEFMARLPAALYGIGSIFAIFLLARHLYDTKTALIASFLLALCPTHVFYSQEARPYSLFFLAIIIVHLAFYKALFSETTGPKWKDWLFYAIACVVAVYTLYFFYIIFLLQIAVFFFYTVAVRKGTLSAHLKYFLPIVVIVTSVFVLNYSRMAEGAEKFETHVAILNPFKAALLPGTLDSLACGYRFYWFSKNCYLVYGTLFLFGALIGFRRKRTETSYLVFMFLGYLVVNILYYISIGSGIYTRYLLVALIPFLTVIAYFITAFGAYLKDKELWGKGRLVLVVFTVVCLGGIASHYLEFLSRPRYTKIGWRHVTAFLKKHSEQDDTIVLGDSTGLRAFRYYLKRENVTNLFVCADGSVDIARDFMSRSKRVWFVTYPIPIFEQMQEFLLDFPGIYGDEFGRFTYLTVRKWENLPLIIQQDQEAFDKGTDFIEKNGKIDIGEDEGGLMWEHWNVTEQWGDTSIRWASWRFSTLCVPLRNPAHYNLSIRVYPFVYPEMAEKQIMTIFVNDVELASLELENQMGLYTVDAPQTCWKEGVNVIRFEFLYHRSPKRTYEESEDPRRLSAAFDFIEFEKVD